MHAMKKYIEMVDHEIKKLTEKESKGLTEKGEMMLHVLFENCKHAKEYMEYVRNSMTDEHMDNPRKSYFGGM